MKDTTPQTPTHYVVLQQPKRTWLRRLVLLLLLGSIFLNFSLLATTASYMSPTLGPNEKFHSGELTATDKIARIVVDFTIMAPYTKRIIEVIEKVTKDDSVKGAILVINSPGGLVSDSHEIYHKLKQLAAKKPVYVAMKGIAASGGYYIAMGAGEGAPIYAEPTTWTGSIGVIVPRYDASELAKKVGVEPDSLTTGPLKETLNPFKELSPEERKVWDEILEESFVRFLTVIDESRTNLDLEKTRALATGQVYTADQALKLGMVDQIGYEEDALAALKTKLGLSNVRVVDYEHQKSAAEILFGSSAISAPAARDPLSLLLDASVPRAMYLFGWQQGLRSGSL
ncbi:signal peptide peptidase SppA [Planctomicrobium sp. SH664]|uniref:signal peptide peptidase SppA n=1 Tax=Planctomicrobium sp. SH664 TaxID=3448125 RepID=UPI003F5BD5FF